ncbi:DUF4942 domain-containing protein [Xenorhabdus bovienii]|uniref:DUF4942 domain-containing protein n=1 Tax=Xenorhabdus bovienii TaxID=40576 RepID=UPI0023B28A67|nr:DUF4942 domain-containing protein [Xenorhabdus bovienii]
MAFREEVSLIREVIAEFNKEQAEREMLHSILYSGDRVEKINQLIGESCKPGQYNRNCLGLPSNIDMDHVRGNLRASYWQKVVDRTNILMLMPAKRREEWREQFIEGKVKKDVPDEFTVGKLRTITEYVGVPEFSELTVVPTLLNLLNDRSVYLNERVYGVFCSLSPNHKTNKSYGFSERLILSNVITDTWHDSVTVSRYKEDYIDDLRAVLQFFAHKQLLNVEPIRHVLSAIYRQSSETHNFGKWVTIDGNLLRVKMFKNGNLHVEIHPDIAWQLNEVLAASLPYAIPSEFRTERKSRNTPKEFGEILTPISSEIRTLIANTSRYSKHSEIYHVSDYHWSQVSDETKRIYESLMKQLGGISEKTRDSFSFPYDFGEVRDFVLTNNAVPETKSHQFYPTPEPIQYYVADMIELQDDETLLEPSAGRGDLLAQINAPKQTTCIELAPLFCKILESKGYNAISTDFLKWSAENTGIMFDKIAMNPPYSKGRAKEHLKAALDHLKAGGRCVAVMPASERMEWIDKSQFEVTDGATFSDEFENTSVTVKVFIINTK